MRSEPALPAGHVRRCRKGLVQRHEVTLDHVMSCETGRTFYQVALRAEEIEDRTVLREEGAMSVWIVYSGVRYGFPSPEALTYAEISLSDVKIVPPGSLIFVPKVPPDGTYVQEWKTGRLYLIRRHRRLLMTEDELFERGDDPKDVVVVPWGTLDGIRYAGRYRQWKAGLLARVVVPASWIVHTRAARISAAWFATSVVGGVVSGAAVTWLFPA